VKSRRRYPFVLLFVLGLVIVSALVIARKPTKLGLDLKGGVELVYQGQPTGKVTSVSGEDIERSIEIIRQRIDSLGVSSPEVARLGTTEITVSLPVLSGRSTRSEPRRSSTSMTGSRT
jgi:SecD/SecF GG Motif.